MHESDLYLERPGVYERDARSVGYVYLKQTYIELCVRKRCTSRIVKEEWKTRK